MTIHDPIERPDSEYGGSQLVGTFDCEPRRGARPTRKEALKLLRHDARYWDAVCRQRDQADEEQSSFMAVLVKSSISGQRLHELADQNEAVEFQRVVSCDNKSNLIIASSPEAQRLHAAINEIPGIRFCYPQAPAGAGRHARLECVFFLPTPLWKRSFDIVGAGLAIILLSPLLLVISLLIRIGSPGAVIFKQQRLGGAAEPFTIWKFRTLRADCTNKQQDYVTTLSKNNGMLTKRKHDSALVPCGRFLRACCLDEFPQLFNVLEGSMSLVGPRPDVLDFDDYSSYQRRRFDVVPGMTGLWQVSGKNKTTFDEMIRFDIAYGYRRSLLLDLWILMRTLPALARQYLEDETT